jgi:lysophospholipase L1-like esterase
LDGIIHDPSADRKKSGGAERIGNKIKIMAEKRICVFGDSIAWGACDNEAGGWVERLKVYVNNKTDYEVAIINAGISGNNTIKLAKRIAGECRARECTDIIIAVGINDTQYSNQGVNRVSEKEFKRNLQIILGKIKKQVKSITIIGLTKVDDSKTTPVIYDPAKNYSNRFINKYNAIIKAFCRSQKIKFIDVYNLLKPNDLYDGLHPNAIGHDKLFKYIKKKLEFINFLKYENRNYR